MNKKYPGYKSNDTFWDDYHRKNNMMTNNEFFTSNAKGGFYEGMEFNGEEWVLNAEQRRKEWDREQKKLNENRCNTCDGQRPYCDCY